MTAWPLAFAFLLAVWPAFAQLPPSATLSDADWQSFRAEVARIEKSLISAPDKATVTYQMARIQASAKQWPETMEWLRKVAALNAGFDPSRDSIFADLRGTREFQEILAAALRATPPVSHSTSVFQVSEGDLIPESVAYDPTRRRFYFGSMRKGKIVRCSASGNCAPFIHGLGTVLGLKARGDGLWLLSNSNTESALLHYDLPSGRLIQKYAIGGLSHDFNDLTFAPAGDIYLTDTRGSAVWHLAKGAARLEQLPGRFEFANGITVSQDGGLLYVSTFPDGITMVDLKTRAATPIVHPADLCLSTIDGLYFYRDALIAIQNGFMSPRVVRFTLTETLRKIERFDILERRNPLFDGVTTGVIAGGEFFYMANIQDSKTAGFSPITTLQIRL